MELLKPDSTELGTLVEKSNNLLNEGCHVLL
jgi:hypothetical protein